MGYIFTKESIDPDYERVDDVVSICDEMQFRMDYIQSLYPGYQKDSWDDLCDKGIKLFEQLKERFNNVIL